jgi:hypothetical protein
LYHLSQYFPDCPEPKTLQELQDYANQLMQALDKMGMFSNKLSSPVAIYEDCVLRYLTLPTIVSSKIPKQAAEFAWRCSGKLWIEAFSLGWHKEVWDYDLQSAFPNIAKDLLDTTNANWIKDDKIHIDANYGFCKGIVTIQKNIKVSPIIYEDEQGNLSTPIGIWNTYLTLAEILFIEKWKLGTFEIHEGHWCYCQPYASKPLLNIANRLLAYKQSDNKIIQLLAKRMSVVGLYGKFGEEHKDSFGKFFNPCWFSYISTLCRLSVADFIYRHNIEDSVLHISVDGILTSEEISNV